MNLHHNLLINIIIKFIILTYHLIPSSSSSSSSSVDAPAVDFHNLQILPYACVTSNDIKKTTTVQSKSLIYCVVMCLNKAECRSISFNTDTMVCHVNELTISSPGAVVVYDTEYRYTEIINRVEWHLAFRATQGIGVNVYDAWTNQGHHDDVTEVTSNTIGCLTVDGRLSCDKHLRTWRLDDWTNVALVKHSFYIDSQEVFHVTFDANGTTSSSRDDHFRISRVVDSSATEMIGFSLNVNFENTEGSDTCGRRFYLNHYWNTCAGDYGWMMVNDISQGCCDYERVPPYPNFMYTTTTSAVNWLSGSVGKAQVFAVYLKYHE